MEPDQKISVPGGSSLEPDQKISVPEGPIWNLSRRNQFLGFQFGPFQKKSIPGGAKFIFPAKIDSWRSKLIWSRPGNMEIQGKSIKSISLYIFPSLLSPWGGPICRVDRKDFRTIPCIFPNCVDTAARDAWKLRHACKVEKCADTTLHKMSEDQHMRWNPPQGHGPCLQIGPLKGTEVRHFKLPQRDPN